MTSAEDIMREVGHTGLNAELIGEDYVANGKAVGYKFHVEGDWKHTHLAFDHMLQQLPGYIGVTEHDAEDTGGDWYASDHLAVFNVSFSNGEVEAYRYLLRKAR